MKVLGWHTIEKSKDLDNLLQAAVLLVRDWPPHKSFVMDDDGNHLHLAFNGDEDAVSVQTVVRFLASEIKGWVGQLYLQQPLTLKHMITIGVGVHPSLDWRKQYVPKYITNNLRNIKPAHYEAKFRSFMATKLHAMWDMDPNLARFHNADPEWREFFLKDETYYNQVYRDGK